MIFSRIFDHLSSRALSAQELFNVYRFQSCAYPSRGAVVVIVLHEDSFNTTSTSERREGVGSIFWPKSIDTLFGAFSWD